jgi:CheY-like chemotaxis protein
MRKHILVVDDDASMRYMSSFALQEAGHKVTSARDGREALSFFHSGKASVDLLLTDLYMPEMTGFELIHELKKIEVALPIIATSSVKDEEIVMQLLAEGCSDFIEKPISLPDLVRRVNRHLGIIPDNRRSLSQEMGDDSTVHP